MNSIIKNKMVWIGLVAVIIVGGIYYFNGSEQGVNASIASSSGEGAGTQQIVDTLAQMQQTNIDSSLFATPVWQSLHDIGTALPMDIPGRFDLFGGSASAGAVPLKLSTSTIR